MAKTGIQRKLLLATAALMALLSPSTAQEYPPGPPIIIDPPVATAPVPGLPPVAEVPPAGPRGRRTTTAAFCCNSAGCCACALLHERTVHRRGSVLRLPGRCAEHPRMAEWPDLGRSRKRHSGASSQCGREQWLAVGRPQTPGALSPRRRS